MNKMMAEGAGEGHKTTAYGEQLKEPEYWLWYKKRLKGYMCMSSEDSIWGRELGELRIRVATSGRQSFLPPKPNEAFSLS